MYAAAASRISPPQEESSEVWLEISPDPKEAASHDGLVELFRSFVANDRTLAYMYLGTWFCLNVVITLYSKAVFSTYKFPYPMTMTCVHMIFTSAGVQLCAYTGLFTPQPLTSHHRKTVIWFSIVFTLNIWMSNASLMAVSVNLHQVVRTTIPLFTMVIALIFFHENYPCTLLPSVVVVILGVAITVWGDMQFDAFGMSIVIFGCVLSALKGILTQKTQVGALGMTALDLLRYLSPLAAIQLTILAVTMGEVNQIMNDSNLNKMLIFHLSTLGCVAFFLNFVSFRNGALNSPLTLNIAGNVKQVFTSLLSIVIFGGVMAPALVAGIVATAIGAFWYSYESQRCKAARRKEEKQEKFEMNKDESAPPPPAPCALHRAEGDTELRDVHFKERTVAPNSPSAPAIFLYDMAPQARIPYSILPQAVTVKAG